jgi:hypothetical protein
LAEYVNGRTDVKPRSVWNYKMAQDSLLRFFDPGKPLRDVTEGDAEGFRLWLKDELAISMEQGMPRKR